MINNILTGNPSSCADGMLTASQHLSKKVEMGISMNSVDPSYAETVASLSKRARPQDCARCIGKYCMLKAETGTIDGEPVQITHSRLIQNSPRRRPEVAYQKLEDQAGYFDFMDIKEGEQRAKTEDTPLAREEKVAAADRHLRTVVGEELKRGVSETAIRDIYEDDLPIAS